jgi:hypothetical protein
MPFTVTSLLIFPSSRIMQAESTPVAKNLDQLATEVYYFMTSIRTFMGLGLKKYDLNVREEFRGSFEHPPPPNSMLKKV